MMLKKTNVKLNHSKSVDEHRGLNLGIFPILWLLMDIVGSLKHGAQQISN